MPSAGLVTMAGMAVFAVVLVSTTVSGLGAVAVMPAIRNDGLPATFLVRVSENTTSAAVTGSPVANFAPWRRGNVYFLASGDAVYDEARSGTGLDTSEPLEVSSVSESGWSVISPVGSNMRAGSSAL